MREEEETSDENKAFNRGNVINSDVEDLDASHSHESKEEERKHKSWLPLRDASLDTHGKTAVKSAENVCSNRKDVIRKKKKGS